MGPLMTPEMHARFVDLRDAVISAEGVAAEVFIPVYSDQPARRSPILFIGQTTRGWQEKKFQAYEIVVERLCRSR